MLDKKKVLEALSRIIDPDLGKDIVSLGFIASLEIKKGHVLVDIRITTPACPVPAKVCNHPPPPAHTSLQ